MEVQPCHERLSSTPVVDAGEFCSDALLEGLEYRVQAQRRKASSATAAQRLVQWDEGRVGFCNAQEVRVSTTPKKLRQHNKRQDKSTTMFARAVTMGAEAKAFVHNPGVSRSPGQHDTTLQS
jgi:hypothetical protein